jgi:hypothetical protein
MPPVRATTSTTAAGAGLGDIGDGVGVGDGVGPGVPVPGAGVGDGLGVPVPGAGSAPPPPLPPQPTTNKANRTIIVRLICTLRGPCLMSIFVTPPYNVTNQICRHERFSRPKIFCNRDYTGGSGGP